MDYGAPFQMVFRSSDPRIKNKLLTGTLYALLSILLTPLLIGLAGFWILGGYGLRLLQNVRIGKEDPLPEWDQWQSDLRSGFLLFVAGIVWYLPFLILSAILTGGDAASAPTLLSVMASLLTTLAGFILGPGVTIAFAQRIRLGDAFRFGRVLAWIGQHWTQCLLVSLVATLVSVLIGVALTIAGTIALVIGLLAAIPFAILMSFLYLYHLYGQLAQSSDLTVMFPEGVE